jgi:large subunit ribosomal protein L29
VRAKELRELGPEELRSRERELREEIFRLRVRRGTGQLASPSKLRDARRDLARVLTILNDGTSAEGKTR